MPDTLPRYSLLEAPLLTAQASAFGLPGESVERLVAIDRILRSAAKGGLLDSQAQAGWALAGPAALLGVYLRGSDLLRVPDSLSFAPIAGRETLDIQVFVNLLATALPGGVAVADSEVGAWDITFAGTLGDGTVPIRLERAPLAFEPPMSARDSEHAEVGYVYDRRLPYLPRVAQTPVAVPVAYAEELLLRLLGALAAPGARPDTAARVDDLRLALALEPGEVRDALAGPVRSALVSGLRQRGLVEAKDIKARLDGIGARVADTVARWSDPDALPAGMRPSTVVYGGAQRQAFEAALDAATAALSRGSR